MRITEGNIQTLVMEWAVWERQHVFAIPNVYGLMGSYHEADVLSCTKAWFLHEFEIKTSIQDYKRDFHKTKHWFFEKGDYHSLPNYFWFVCPFEIESPEYAGWLEVKEHKHKHGELYLDVRKKAPRLHMDKLSEHNKTLAMGYLSRRIIKLKQVVNEQYNHKGT